MKLDKKLGIVMIFVVLALVSIGTVAALTIKYPTIKGLSGEAILKILVNTVILAALAYFILPMILGKERTPQSKEGHTAMLVIIILLSIFIAVTIGNRYLWDVSTIKDIADYFIGSEGVLRADRIGIFIGATALFTWFLSFLGVGGNKEKGGVGKMNFALAFLIGMHLASEGMSANTLIGIGQAFALIIFWQNIYKNMDIKLAIKTKIGELNLWPIISGMIAIMIVGWIGSILSPCGWGWFGVFKSTTGECAGVPEPTLKGAVEVIQEEGVAGLPSALWSITLFFLKNWWLVFVVIFVLLLIGAWAAKKERDFVTAKAGILSEGFTRIFNRFRDLIRNRNIPLLWRLFKRKEIFDREMKGQIPMSWEALTVLLHVFYNWILRLEVYVTKNRVTIRAEEDTRKIEKEVMTDTKDINNIRSDTKMYKEGSEIVNNRNGGFELAAHYATYTRTTGRKSGAKTPTSHGALNMEWFVLKFLNLFKGQLESDVGGKNPKLAIRDNTSNDEKNKLQESLIRGQMEKLKREFEKDRDDRFWNGAHKRYCYWHRIRSLRAPLLDQFRLYGRYFHSYKFANENAKVYMYDYDRDLALKGSPLNRKLIPIRRIGIHSEKAGVLKKRPENQYNIPLLHEVDHRGIFTEDMNDILVEGKELPYVRKIMPIRTNIVDHEDSHEIMDWLKHEWEAFLDDLRFGTYHPNSLTYMHYEKCMDPDYKDFSFKTAEKQVVSVEPGPSNPAFDLEALKDPGLFTSTYWGRKNYYEENNYSINTGKFTNPLPAISTLGITKFIATYIQRKTNPITAREFLSYLVGDSGGKIDSVFTYLNELEKAIEEKK